MSEYQYYEFHAIDRALTERERSELRACSSRATITSTRFVNSYDWGDLKGDPVAWMERYFDAHLYLANWGTHVLMLRFPRDALDPETLDACLCGYSANSRATGDFVILSFCNGENEPPEDWDDGSGWLADLLPLRADIAAGDHRALYLAWLLCAQNGEVDDGATEPPVPPGLGQLTGPLQAFAGFLNIDDDLIAAAAQASAPIAEEDFTDELWRWVAALSDDDKTALLRRCVSDGDGRVRGQMLRRFRKQRPADRAGGQPRSRTVAEINAIAERLAAQRRRRDAERAAKERARREREEVARREAYLNTLAEREAAAWREVDTLVAEMLPRAYDRAAQLLADLRDLGLRDGRLGDVEARVGALAERHARKRTFIARLEKAGLGHSPR